MRKRARSRGLFFHCRIRMQRRFASLWRAKMSGTFVAGEGRLIDRIGRGQIADGAIPSALAHR